MLRFCRTYIFTFDSLGGQHPKVIRELSEYLKMEALDKKKIVITGKVGSKSVPVCSQAIFSATSFFDSFLQVPAQPNFCDCGIYLLHLAQTFMSNPVHYRSMILVSLHSLIFILQYLLTYVIRQIKK
jgi:Ulp1 family protease